MPCPKRGNVGRFGERIGGGSAPVAAGKPVVAALSVQNLGNAADVELCDAVAADGWPDPDPVCGADIDLGRLPGGREPERVATGSAVPADPPAGE